MADEKDTFYQPPFTRILKTGRVQACSKYKDESGNWKQKTCLIPKRYTSERSIKRYTMTWWRGINEEREKANKSLEADTQCMTVTEAIQMMLDEKLASNIIERSTYSKEQTILKRAARHPIGSMPIDTVTEEDCNDFFRYLRDERGLAINTVRTSQMQMKSAFWYALKAKHTSNNPMQFITLYPKTKQIANAVTRTEANNFFAAVNLKTNIGDRYYTCIWIAFYTGMREAEIAALRWGDVSFRAKRITVTQSIGKDDANRDSGCDTYIKTTKSKKRRVIPINDKLIEVFRRRYVYQTAERKGVEPSPTTYVVGFPDDRYIRPQSISAWWIRFSRNNQLAGNQHRRVKFHDIRHSFATNMLSEGADVNSVASIMGHADASTTLDIYATPDEQAIRNAIETAGLFNGFGD